MRPANPLRGTYYGWVLVGTLGVTETISWGVLYYAFTVFVTPMQAEMGWSRGQTTGAFSLALLLSGVAAYPAGRWQDRHGPRLLMTAGSVLAVLLVLAWSQVQSLVVLYALWALIGMVSATVLYQPAFAVVAVWFSRRRSGAMTLLTLMAGWASIIFIPLAGWLVEAQGWRMALVTLAAILALGTILPHALLLRRRPEDQGLAPDGEPLLATTRQTAAMTEPPASWRTIVRDPTFRMLTLGFALAGFAEGVLSVHLVPYLAESGSGGPSAATAAGLIGLAALGSRVVYAPFADRLPDHLVAAGIFTLQAVSLLVLLVASGAFAVLAFVALYGASRGLVSPTRASIVGTLYGRASYASIGGLLALFVVGAQSVAPVSAGVAFDLTARYEPIWLVLALISVLAAALVLRAGSRASAPAETPV